MIIVLIFILPCVVDSDNYPYISFDGMFNNPSNPDWGSTNTPLGQPVRPNYKDGSSSVDDTNKTSAREISNLLFTENYNDSYFSGRFNALVPYFLQFVNSDIVNLDTIACPPEQIYIPIKATDPVYRNQSDKQMPLDRTKYLLESGHWSDHPRVQLNSVSAWLDCSQVYGVSKGWADILRAGEDGEMCSKDTYPLKNVWKLPLQNKLKPTTCTYDDVSELRVFGNPGAHENPGLYALQWLFLNEHNNLAKELNRSMGMNDKWLFDKTRFLTIAKLQKIILYDLLPTLTGQSTPPYTKYNPERNPAINFLYAGAVQYFYYTMFPSTIYVSEAGKCAASTDHRLCNSYWDGQSFVEKYGPRNILSGLSYQHASDIDNNVISDLLSYYHGPMHWTRRDAIALAIQRGRDLGVPSLNTVLEYYDLAPMTWPEWRIQLNNKVLMKSLKRAYSNDVDAVELFVGGMLLSRDGHLSHIFKLIMREQLLSLRDSDRYWFENPHNGMGLRQHEIDRIKTISLSDILAGNNVSLFGNQANVFLLDGLSPQCKTQRPAELGECIGDMMLHFNYNTTPYAMPLLVPILTLLTVCLVLLLAYLARKRRLPNKIQAVDEDVEKYTSSKYGVIYELQAKNGDRIIDIELDKHGGYLFTRSKGVIVRKVAWRGLESVPIMTCSDNPLLLLISIPKEYDIFLKFTTQTTRQDFLDDMLLFSSTLGVSSTVNCISVKHMMKVSKTETQRLRLVESFISAIFSEMMKRDGYHSEELEEEVDKQNLKGVGSNVLECELSREEFASAMGLKPEQEFVDKIFPLVDRDKNGRISFREFLSFMIVYSSGSSTDKLKLIFNMYDYDNNGSLHVDEIKRMIKSMLEMVAASIKPEELDSLILSLFKQAQLEDKTEISFQEFTRIMAGYQKDIENAQLKVHSATPSSHVQKTKRHFTSVIKTTNERRRKIKRYIENNRLEIFYTAMFLLIVVVLFAERFTTYSKYKYHTGFPQLLGYSLSLSRGSAAVILFTFPLFMLVMCKNTITHLRATFLKRYIPFDANRQAHILIGMVSLFFSITHCLGHGYNFYMISTLSPQHLSCLMPKTWFDGHNYATITTLLFGTITGISGVLLVAALLVMYIFSTQYARQHVFSCFWNTHRLYPVVFALIFLHGTARLLQEPTFQYYLVGPALIFTFDKLISISRKKREIPLLHANILPSEVTNLVFKRPANFTFLAGQYVDIALVNAGRDEYHPFTLTSAPHEDYLSVHIRTCKGWTKLLRTLCTRHEKNPERLPNLYVDGPFGEAHQDYFNYEVVILVGGGIGVTPFSSIIKDLVHKSNTCNLFKVRKVYFLWATRTQRQFEWLLDIIGKCEAEDTKNLLDTHIFITKFYQKLDLRTTILYICERHFQGISNRSLFTGLKAITHFGRPDFDKIFNRISVEHPVVRKFGVFVCGPPALADTVKQSCANFPGKQIFSAYAENF